MGWAMLIKSLIQFSVDEWGSLPSLLFYMRPNSGGGNDNGNLLQSVTCEQATANPRLHRRLLDTHRQVSLLWGHHSFLLGPGEHRILSVPSKRSVSQVLCKFCNQIPSAFKVKFPGHSQSLCQISRLGNLLCTIELS